MSPATPGTAAPPTGGTRRTSTHIKFDSLNTENLYESLTPISEDELYLNEHRELGLSHYDTHSDGSGVSKSRTPAPRSVGNRCEPGHDHGTGRPAGAAPRASAHSEHRSGSSARDAAALGFLNIMVSDAMATRTDVEHNATLVNVMQLVADVRTTEEVIALMMMAALIDYVERGNDHDADPLRYRLPNMDFTLDMRFCSRKREINRESSFSVVG